LFLRRAPPSCSNDFFSHDFLEENARKVNVQVVSGWSLPPKEVLQKESGRRLCYINSRCTVHPWGVFSVISGASSVKIWHPLRAGIEKGSEEGKGKGNG
jgi:hypothetical protein